MKKIIKLICYVLLLNLIPSLGNAVCGNAELDELIPDEYLLTYSTGLTKFSFVPACEQHDKCYDDCSVTNANHKQFCEESFHKNLEAQCPNNCGQTCSNLSKVYYNGVKTFGHDSYKAAQEQCFETWIYDFLVKNIDWKQFNTGMNHELLNLLQSINSEKFVQEFIDGLKSKTDALYKQKINVLLTDIKALFKIHDLAKMSEQRLEQFNKILETKLNMVDNLVQMIFARYRTISSQTIEKIQADNLINDQFQQLQQDLRKEINNFFARTKILSDLMSCKKKDISVGIENLLSQLDSPKNLTMLKNCYQQLGLTKKPNMILVSMRYNLNKCYKLKLLSVNSKVSEIVATYAELKNQAELMICKTSNSDLFPDYWWDWVEFDYHHQFWSKY